MKPRFWIFSILVVVHLAWAAEVRNKRSDAVKEILATLLLNKYHSYVKPEKSVNITTDESVEPLDIYVSMYVINIDIDTKNQECEILIYFRQKWHDSRSIFEPKDGVNVLSFNDPTGFWTPDLFFVNEKTGHFHQLTKQNSFLRIFSQGEILYSQRLTIKISCPMDLRKYPFDRQTCILPIESYGYSAEDLMLKWKDDVIENARIQPPEFHVSFSTSEKIIHLGKKYSRLELEINIERVPYAQIFHIYLPLGLLVVASWISFWFRPSSHLPRLTTTVLTILASLSVLQTTKDFFYLQCYFTALDIWTGFSMLLIFGAFLETVYVLGIQRDLKAQIPTTDGVMSQKNVPEIPRSEKGEGKVKSIIGGLLLKDSNTDDIAKVAFPVSFLLFNLMYCIYIFM